MENFDELDEQVGLSPRGRKQKPDKSNTAREKAKKARHDGTSKQPTLACAHNVHNFCLAGSLVPDDLKYAHDQLYQTTEKVKQDATLLSYMNISSVGHRRPKLVDVRNIQPVNKKRDYTVHYCMINSASNKIPLCKASFMSIFGVKKDCLANLAKYWLSKGTARPENRGGARNIERAKARRDAIQCHIMSFTCRASHYARRACPGRKYLPTDLSVKKNA